MKKILLSAVALMALSFGAEAQETKFGIKAGADFATSKAEFMGEEFTASETGFFVGAFAEIGLSESFALQPEILYIGIKDFNTISVPVLAKYYVLPEKFSLMVGPDFNYLLDAEEDEFKVNLSAGASYNFTENFDVSARYSLGFGDVTLSGLFVGVGYKFQ